MSPPRRRSARLASSAPKGKALPELSSVAERDEAPARGASSNLDAILSSPLPVPTTPVSSTIKPPRDEMHPSKAHQTMAPPSSGLNLGFTDIKSPVNGHAPPFAQSTPSKIGGTPRSPFSFQIARQAADVELTEDAQRLMDELRDKAAKIKADLVAQREADGGSPDINDRKIAKPKGKSGRYSAAHMAEFKKMDSIEGHASAWRAQNGKFTPVTSGIKRSPSKANLDGTPAPLKPSLKRSPSKAQLDDTPNSSKVELKHSSSMASLNSRAPTGFKKSTPLPSPAKTRLTERDGHPSSAKRVKQRQQDDISDGRPISRDGSSIPRPKSSHGTLSQSQSQTNLARLMSPTKASLAQAASPVKPTITLVKSPSVSSLGSLPKSTTTSSLVSPSRTADFKRRIISPGRFQRVRSILRGSKTETGSPQTALPQPASFMSLTPAPPRLSKALPPLPLTTPRRKVSKHVAFTPEAIRAAVSQNSPSPLKSGPPRAKLKRKLDGVQYPTQSESDGVVYPELPSLQAWQKLPEQENPVGPQSTPGTFTFRSDHTIRFGGASPTGFGAYPGQSSVRQVRGSIMPTINMPGSFPAPPSPSSHPNKENKAPEPVKTLFGAPHGMSSKKRNRPSGDEEDAEAEAAERAVKKRKNEHVPEGQAIVAPRLATTTPVSSAKKLQRGRGMSRTPGSASPSKKRPVLSMSRLNMLARPKARP